MAQMVTNLPAMRETWVRSLGWEDPLEEGMAAHSSILAWRIHVNPGAWWASPWGQKESDTTEWLSTALCLYDHFFYSPLRGKDRVYVSCCFFWPHLMACRTSLTRDQTCVPAVDRGPTQKLTICYLFFDFWQHVGLYNSQVTVIKCILNGCPYLSCW